jgi:hypothetical protein
MNNRREGQHEAAEKETKIERSLDSQNDEKKIKKGKVNSRSKTKPKKVLQTSSERATNDNKQSKTFEAKQSRRMMTRMKNQKTQHIIHDRRRGKMKAKEDHKTKRSKEAAEKNHDHKKRKLTSEKRNERGRKRIRRMRG